MDILFVNLLGALLILGIVWYFFLSRRPDRAVAEEASGVQEVEVRVKGGYVPEVVVARPGVPLRILFRREETSPCSEEVVFPEFGIRRRLPSYETTVVEIPASQEGRYSFSCGMNMMHGTLVLGESARAQESAHVTSPRPVHETAKEGPALAAPPSGGGPGRATSIDPICGMRVDPANAPATTVRDGVTVHFCSAGCKSRFEARPTEHPVTLYPRQKV